MKMSAARWITSTSPASLRLHHRLNLYLGQRRFHRRARFLQQDVDVRGGIPVAVARPPAPQHQRRQGRHGKPRNGRHVRYGPDHLDFAGIKPPADIQGRSMKPLLTGCFAAGRDAPTITITESRGRHAAGLARMKSWASARRRKSWCFIRLGKADRSGNTSNLRMTTPRCTIAMPRGRANQSGRIEKETAPA